MYKKANTLLFNIGITLLLGLMLFLVLLGVRITTENVNISFEPPSDFSRNWTNTSTGEMLSDPTGIYLGPGESITIEKHLPLHLGYGRYLGINNTQLHISVYVNNHIIYETGKDSPLKFGHELGHVWNMIPLSSEHSGNVITLVVENLGNRQHFMLDSLCIGFKNTIIHKIILDTLPNIVESIIAALLSFLMLMYCFLLIRYRIRGYRHIIVYLTLLSVDFSVWFFMEGTALQIMSCNPTIRYMTSYFSFFLLPVFLLLFLRSILHKKSKIIDYSLTAYTFILSALLVLYKVNLLHISSTFYLVHVIIIAVAVMAVYLLYHDYRFSRNTALRGSAAASVFLIVTSAAELVFCYFNCREDNIVAFHFAYLIFLLTVAFMVGRESLNQFKDVIMLQHYKKLAYTDAITGGHTRNRFNDRLKDIYNNKEQGFWLLHMNLVNFKVVNESIGWENGNLLLHEIYASNEKLLTSKEMQCNLGNATMAFFIDAGNDYTALHNRCAQIKENTEKCIHDMYDTLSIQTSFSLCKLSDNGEELDKLLDHALMAYNHEKAQHWSDINCYLYNDNCSKQLLFEKKLENLLPTALANHEFEMYLQPKICLKTGKVAGAEALIRWNSPIGIINPGQFIPLFEKKGLIAEIDLYMFRQVCELLHKWDVCGDELTRISVNVSKHSIEKARTLRQYGQILAESKVPAKYLEYEITESLAYDDFPKLQNLISWIHSQGAHCSMDDFGSSYSNFNAIKELAFDTIKLDTCFFDGDFPNMKKNREMVSGLVQLFKTLGIEVVAEGIRTRAQVDFLRSIDCDLIQGYYYSNPLSVKDFETYRSIINDKYDELA